MTLANLNAVGKQTARKRYARIYAKQNSDGDAQCLVTEINAETATDSGGVSITFPSAGQVLDGVDRGDGVSGTRIDAEAEYYRQDGAAYGDPASPISGTLPANKVLKSATPAGNYNDDNLIPPNIAAGVAFGLDQEGELSGGEGTQWIPKTQRIGA
jgi:hypothetical protein